MYLPNTFIQLDIIQSLSLALFVSFLMGTSSGNAQLFEFSDKCKKSCKWEKHRTNEVVITDVNLFRHLVINQLN